MSDKRRGSILVQDFYQFELLLNPLLHGAPFEFLLSTSFAAIMVRAHVDELQKSAAEKMTVGMFDPCASVSSRFLENLTGILMKADVDYFYFEQRGACWPVFSAPGSMVTSQPHLPFDLPTPLLTEWEVQLVLRASENERDEDDTRDTYVSGMKRYGYNSDGRSPMITTTCK